MRIFESEKEIKERLQNTVCGRQDPNNMYPPSTSAQEAFDELVRYFMGEDYMYSYTDPITNGQWNTNALCDVELAYRKSVLRLFNKVIYKM